MQLEELKRNVGGGGEGKKSLTWIKSKVIDQTLPGDKSDFLDGRRGAAKAQLLQMEQGVDKGTSSVEQLRSKHEVGEVASFRITKSHCLKSRFRFQSRKFFSPSTNSVFFFSVY